MSSINSASGGISADYSAIQNAYLCEENRLKEFDTEWNRLDEADRKSTRYQDYILNPLSGYTRNEVASGFKSDAANARGRVYGSINSSDSKAKWLGDRSDQFADFKAADKNSGERAA